jgi:tripartite-type tricarboxylate transporter receptor subunit TctC
LRIVTGAPGSTPQFAARRLGQGLSDALGQTAVVDPCATGSATIFGEIVARAAPDGHTLLVIGSTRWLGPLFRRAPFDPMTDFSYQRRQGARDCGYRFEALQRVSRSADGGSNSAWL